MLISQYQEYLFIHINIVCICYVCRFDYDHSRREKIFSAPRIAESSATANKCVLLPYSSVDAK